ncbi:hypothetical protein ACWD4X_23595 [Streptomyces termitum]
MPTSTAHAPSDRSASDHAADRTPRTGEPPGPPPREAVVRRFPAAPAVPSAPVVRHQVRGCARQIPLVARRPGRPNGSDGPAAPARDRA